MAVTDTLIDTLFDGRYRIVRKLGTGGMANVYLAEDQELGRSVAIKILDDRHAADEQFVERFRREAKNAASLSHPNIVAIYDRGEAEGTYYIAMEYLDGRTLKELLVRFGHAAGQDRDRLHAPDSVRARVRAQVRPRPPRHQAAQRARRLRRAREGHGLRHRALRVEPDDRGRFDHRHRAVPLARAGARRARRPALGHLLGGSPPLRAADRRRALYRRHAGRDRDEAPVRRSRAAVEEAPGRAARARPRGRARTRKGSGGPLPERRGDGRRARAHRAGLPRQRRDRRRGHGRAGRGGDRHHRRSQRPRRHDRRVPSSTGGLPAAGEEAAEMAMAGRAAGARRGSGARLVPGAPRGRAPRAELRPGPVRGGDRGSPGDPEARQGRPGPQDRANGRAPTSPRAR